jgi:antigen flippase
MAAQAQAQPQGTYGQILKSSVLVGGSSAINIVIGIARTKAVAMLLGPAGFGLFGLYGSIADLTSSLAGLGVNSSGVRQIAESAGSGQLYRIAGTAAVLRRTSLLLGLVGAMSLFALSNQVSLLTFGNAKYTGGVCLLSVAVFFRLVAGGQGALIQGMRRISDLAKMSVFSGVFGLVLTIPLVYVFRDKGIVPSLVGVAGMTIITSWWYSRKIEIAPTSVTSHLLRREIAALLKLGCAFMATGFLAMGAAYVIRIMLVRQIGLEATGYYQSAWTLGGLYVGFILQAMGADFYPRLTACANDNLACNQLVNEQAAVGLLLAGPGVLATLTCAPIVIALFYSAKFHSAIGVLRWICLGTFMQVVSWPVGFILLAKARPTLFVLSDLIWTIFYLGLAWVCIRTFGLNGAGIAFSGASVFHGLLSYVIARPLSGFGWSYENMLTGSLFLGLIAIVFCGFYVLPFDWAVGIGALAVLLSSVYSLRRLITVAGPDRLPAICRRFVPCRWPWRVRP